MNKALILGVGPAQRDAIHYLREKGWRIIGCSYIQEDDRTCCDKFVLTDIADFDGIEELARKEKVDLVYSVGSDIAMPTISTVSEKLGLPVLVEYDTVLLMLDKGKLRDFLVSHNISPVKYKRVSSLKDVEDWDHFPVMVKPVDSQGQRGVFCAKTRQEIEGGLARSLNFSRSGSVILEEFLEGPEVSANVFVFHGRIIFNAISDRLVLGNLPGGIPRGHVIPSLTCTGDILHETEELIARCIEAFSIRDGPVYFQIKLTSSGPRIIEISPRLDGCHLWRLIRFAGAADLMEATFALLTRRDEASINLEMTTRGKDFHLLLYFLSPPDRVFKSSDHTSPPHVSYLEYYYKDNQTIRPVNGLMEKVGYYIKPESLENVKMHLSNDHAGLPCS